MKIKKSYISVSISLVPMLILLLVLFSYDAVSYAQIPDFVWAVQAGGGTGNNMDTGYAIAVDSEGNSYITGRFMGDAYFGEIFVQVPRISTFIAKVSPAGEYLWVQSVTGSEIIIGTSIDLYDDSYAYITGYFSGTVTIGSTTLVSSGSYDLFAARLDSDGNFLWAVKAGGSGEDIARAIAIDSLGNAVVTGRFHQTAMFAGTQLNSYGDNDIFITKINSDGSFVWAVNAGGAGGCPG